MYQQSFENFVRIFRSAMRAFSNQSRLEDSLRVQAMKTSLVIHVLKDMRRSLFPQHLLLAQSNVAFAFLKWEGKVTSEELALLLKGTATEADRNMGRSNPDRAFFSETQ